MKLGFVSTASTWGGGERLLIQLIEGCVAAGVETTLAAPAASDLLTRADAAGGIELAPLTGRGRTPADWWRLRAAFAKGAEFAEGFDAVVLNDPHAITYGGATLARWQADGPLRLGVRHTCFPLRSPWKHTRLVDHVVCVSAATRDNCITAGVPADRLTVVHGGLAPATPTPEQIATARTSLGRSQGDETTLLAIGSLLPVKGFDTIIRAVARAAVEGQRWRLAIAGEGPERPRLEALADKLGVADRVCLLGFRDDTPALLAAADVLVNASHNEGLSLVLLEAMHAGAPIVSTSVGGSAEVLGVDPAGSTPVARLFEPGDADGAYQQINACVRRTTETRRLTLQASQRAAECFSAPSMVAGYTALVRHLQAARTRRAA
ncbi:MAG: glycosyltransferase [Planctomycetota bacterium]